MSAMESRFTPFAPWAEKHVLAAAPLAVILVGMGALRRSAVVAGSAGLAVALVLTLTTFGLGGETSEIRAGLGTLAEAAHSTATILWIILPALSIFEFQSRTGAIERICGTLGALSDDRRVQALLIAWFFGLFMEGAAGFGTPVALAAPLLVGLGYSPVRAVVLALLGHAAGVSFGAVGTPVLAQVELSSLNPGETAVITALLHAVAEPVLLLFMVRLAGDTALSRSDLIGSELAALCFFLPSLALAYLVGPKLPTLGGALIGTAAFVIILRRQGSPSDLDLRGLLPDLAPYLLILLFVLATRLIPPLKDVLTGLVLSWSLNDSFCGTFQPLYHPETILFLGFFTGAFITGSATASNILFTGLQLSTASSLSLAPMTMAGAQSFGAAIGNVIAPHNIIAGSATVGLAGREGDILAQTVGPFAIYLGVGGAVVGFLLWM